MNTKEAVRRTELTIPTELATGFLTGDWNILDNHIDDAEFNNAFSMLTNELQGDFDFRCIEVKDDSHLTSDHEMEEYGIGEMMCSTFVFEEFE